MKKKRENALKGKGFSRHPNCFDISGHQTSRWYGLTKMEKQCLRIVSMTRACQLVLAIFGFEFEPIKVCLETCQPRIGQVQG